MKKLVRRWFGGIRYLGSAHDAKRKECTSRRLRRRPANLRPCSSFKKYRCRVSPVVSIISRHSPSAGS